MARRPVVTIVGGGVWLSALLDRLVEARLPALEIRVLGRDAERLRAISSHCAARLALSAPDWTLRGFREADPALGDADAVVLALRVGGAAAREHDETFPRAFGLVGDEGVGVGGFANAWRTAPTVRGLAATVARVAPRAMVLNMVAPLGITTRVLLEAGCRAVGVCELPATTRLQLFGSAGGSLAYGGLNHVGWFWPRDVRGQRVLEDAASAGLVDAAVLQAYGAAPLRYVMEVFVRDAGQRLRLQRSPDRARSLAALAGTILERFDRDPGADVPELARRAMPWWDQALAPALRAALGGAASRQELNLRNGSTIPELPPDAIVETECTLTAAAAASAPPGPLPPPVARFLAALALAEGLAYHSSATRDVALMERAIEALPLALPAASVPPLARMVCAA